MESTNGEHCYWKVIEYLKYLEYLKLQKQCIWITENAGHNSHTYPPFKKLKLLKLDDVIEHELCKLAFHIQYYT